MTREEVLEILEHNWTCLKNHAYTDNELDEALEFIIKALMDVPDNNVGKIDIADSDRAVSLKAVIDILNEIQADIEDGEGFNYNKWKETVNELPPVTLIPERPKGHWIGVSSYDAFGGDYETWMAHGDPIAYHYCSECKEECYNDEDGKEILSDFCPFCGADMRGDDNADCD